MASTSIAEASVLANEIRWPQHVVIAWRRRAFLHSLGQKRHRCAAMQAFVWPFGLRNLTSLFETTVDWVAPIT